MENEDVRSLLRSVKRIAVVGCSRDPSKDAHTVPSFLKTVGYDVIPVNPYADEILGERCYDSLLDASEGTGGAIELVDVFRPSGEVPEILDQTLETGAGGLWLQLGIRHEESARKALENGLTFFQDKCIKVEYTRLFGQTAVSDL